MKYLGSKTIETERLLLKAQTMEEQEYLWSVLMIPEVNQYYLTVPKKFSEKLKDWNLQKEYYQKEMEHANHLDVFKWSVFIKETGECIGRVTCQETKEEHPSIRDVGWYIDPKYQGNGYGKEAAFAMMHYMFQECEIEEIRTGASIQNPASWKIMEEFGMERQDQTKQIEYTYVDKPVEAYQYVLTKEKYWKNIQVDKSKKL